MNDNLEKVEVEETPQQPHWVDSIDFKQLYHIKGHQGLFYPLAVPNKGKMAMLGRFMTNEKAWYKRKDLTNMGNYQFHQQEGTITMGEVFKYMEFNYEHLKIATEDSGYIDFKDHLHLFVPDYDQDEFKFYHAAKLWRWFEELRGKIVKYEQLEGAKIE